MSIITEEAYMIYNMYRPGEISIHQALLRAGYSTLLAWKGRYDLSRLKTSRSILHVVRELSNLLGAVSFLSGETIPSPWPSWLDVKTQTGNNICIFSKNIFVVNCWSISIRRIVKKKRQVILTVSLRSYAYHLHIVCISICIAWQTWLLDRKSNGGSILI